MTIQTRMLVTLGAFVAVAASLAGSARAANCTVSPLGPGKDDSNQIEAAIKDCGQGGSTLFTSGEYNVTRKLWWDLKDARVDLKGYFNFKFDLPYWMDRANTYQAVPIQSQSTWWVITGNNFVVDAHNAGGIIGNGQDWWDWYGNASRFGGDGRPVSLTLTDVDNGVIKDFRIDHPPFWCTALISSKNVVYDGLWVNASNSNPLYFGQNIVFNTDGIDTYRSDNISLLNWDISTGDDCIAIKGNSTNIHAKNITCHGGNGIAFGSLGQYEDLADNVNNVLLEDIYILQDDRAIQPNMISGVFFKSWTGTKIGWPPIQGGAGPGLVKGIEVRNMYVENVTYPVQVFQTYGGRAGDAPSKLQFKDLSFSNITGTASGNILVDIECSAAAPCPNITFTDFNVQPLAGGPARYNCYNVPGGLYGLPSCNTTAALEDGDYDAKMDYWSAICSWFSSAMQVNYQR